MKARPLWSSNCANGNGFIDSSSHARVSVRTSRAAVPRTRTRTTDCWARSLSVANALWRFWRATSASRKLKSNVCQPMVATGSFSIFGCLPLALISTSATEPQSRRSKASGSGVPGMSMRPLSSKSQLCQCPRHRKSSCARVAAFLAIGKSLSSRRLGMSGLPCVTPTLIFSSGNCFASSTSLRLGSIVDFFCWSGDARINPLSSSANSACRNTRTVLAVLWKLARFQIEPGPMAGS